MLLFGVFVVVVTAAAEAVDEMFEDFGAVASFLLLKPPVGNPMNEETADLKESSLTLFFPVFFGGECFFWRSLL